MNQWYLQPVIDHIAVVNDNMKAHVSVVELNASKGGKKIAYYCPNQSYLLEVQRYHLVMSSLILARL